MNFLITGAQFHNKGAQSLLFSVMSEIYSRYRDAEIYYLPLDRHNAYLSGNYRFHLVFDDQSYKELAGALPKLKRRVKIAIDPYRRHKDFCDLSRILPKIDVMLDVSGYQLTSKARIDGSKRLLRFIGSAKDNGAKVFLLPQSFGPCAFNDPSFDARITETLKRADIVYAREEDGMTLLRDQYGVYENVRLSPDIVLQSASDPSYVCHTPPKKHVPSIDTTGNVGIVPNTQTFRHGDRDAILVLYRKVIDRVLAGGKNVYLFRHSDDLAVCEEIAALYNGDARVHLIRDEMNSFEYGEFVRGFDFLVASRYHAIVHAYKQYVPALILGWAVKYDALAALFGQRKYVFDITAETNTEKLLAAVDELLANAKAESQAIESGMKTVKENTCFDELFRML